MQESCSESFWHKLGLVYCASGESDWMCSRAFLPTPILLNKDVVRVYSTFLDEDDIGRTGYVDVSAQDPTHIIKISDTPCLDKGEPGSFDDSGVTASCIIHVDGKQYMYYQGWQRLHFVPYNIFSGLAVSEDGGETFAKIQKCPILDRIETQQNIRSAPFVLKDDRDWMLWSCSGSGFKDVKSRPLPVYGISCSMSASAVSFPSEPTWCIYPEKDQDDIYGYARPWVIKKNGVFLIWYSERSASKIYRSKFAISRDGMNWKACDDKFSVQPSMSGWDSEMVAFSAVIETDYGTYMFYNGNGCGTSGFGVAKLTVNNLDHLIQVAG
ncbi:MAG: glucosyl hydrolase [Alphaproteobacteria bacterium]|nr:glucosyl hydrolase [Alphaproteobacteria bacterium]